MENQNLFKGIGMVVDDEVNSGKDKAIDGIVKYLENDNHLPLVKYDVLPDDIELSCLSKLSFLLLDWELNTLKDADGNPISNDALKNQNIRANVAFIKQVVNNVVIPIFIFSNENVNSIKNTLSQYEIITDDENEPIFILGKSDLFDNENKCIMFDKVNEWLKKTPSIYVTQKWKTAYLDAINGMALDMRTASPFWPNLLWNNYKNDGVNPSEEISSLMNQNALSRIQPVKFDGDILSEIVDDDNKSALKNVLERQCFLKKDKLQNQSTTGDIYQKDKRTYFLNVRPACDCVDRKGDSKVYLIRGEKLSSSNQQNFFDIKYGIFKEQHNFVIVGPVEGVFLRFFFKDMEIVDYENVKNQRIGRLLPPFITRVTQKYGLYIHRQGLPRIPKEIVLHSIPTEGNEQDGDEGKALQEELDEANVIMQQLSKENNELKAKMKRMMNSQNCYRLYNCKVTISPSLKKRKGKR